jgi:hypothetical protein
VPKKPSRIEFRHPAEPQPWGSQRSMKAMRDSSSSFRRKPESSFFEAFWTPACAGVTGFGRFLDTLSEAEPGGPKARPLR